MLVGTFPHGKEIERKILDIIGDYNCDEKRNVLYEILVDGKIARLKIGHLRYYYNQTDTT